MSNQFHNTVKIEDTQLLMQFESTATKQGDLILEMFKAYNKSVFTPWEIHQLLKARGHDILITSVRRSISNLTKSGDLIMLSKDHQKTEKYKVPNNVWQYNEFKTTIKP